MVTGTYTSWWHSRQQAVHTMLRSCTLNGQRIVGPLAVSRMSTGGCAFRTRSVDAPKGEMHESRVRPNEVKLSKPPQAVDGSDTIPSAGQTHDPCRGASRQIAKMGPIQVNNATTESSNDQNKTTGGKRAKEQTLSHGFPPLSQVSRKWDRRPKAASHPSGFAFPLLRLV